MDSIPVIFVHSGYFEWMPQVIKQAARYNKDVYLVSDSHGELPCVFNITDYQIDLPQFDKAYVNLSGNPRWFELACFMRWFVLYRFMEKHQIDVCFHPDSDVLMYANVTEEFWGKFSSYDITLIKGSCGASTFITLDRVRSLCEFFLSVYTEKGTTFQWLADMYADFQRQCLDGGVCDMTLLKLYVARYAIPFAEMTNIVNGVAYDHVLRESDGFDMQGNRKYLEFRNGLPYARLMNGEYVRMATLHLQGDHDKLIPGFLEMSNVLG